MTFSSPNQSVSLTSNIIDFADGTIGMTAGDPTKSITDMLDRMEYDAQLWNELLWASGMIFYIYITS